jgi:hypothetical protein
MRKQKTKMKRVRKRPVHLPDPKLASEAGLTCGVCRAQSEFYDPSQPDYRQRERCAAHNVNERAIKYARSREGMISDRTAQRVQAQGEAVAAPRGQ